MTTTKKRVQTFLDDELFQAFEAYAKSKQLSSSAALEKVLKSFFGFEQLSEQKSELPQIREIVVLEVLRILSQQRVVTEERIEVVDSRLATIEKLLVNADFVVYSKPEISDPQEQELPGQLALPIGEQLGEQVEEKATIPQEPIGEQASEQLSEQESEQESEQPSETGFVICKLVEKKIVSLWGGRKWELVSDSVLETAKRYTSLGIAEGVAKRLKPNDSYHEYTIRANDFKTVRRLLS